MQRVTTLQSTSATDPGRIRTINADSLVTHEPSGPLERVQKGTIWVIADGLGGGKHSMQVSRFAARTVADAYWGSAIPDPASRLRAALERTNHVLHAQNDPAKAADSPSGATVLAAVIIENTLIIAHAGRSRAYLMREGELRQLTEDHTWVARAIQRGEITPEEAETHPRRNVITRCLGIQDRILVDVIEEPLQPGDVLMLCSDGLSRDVDDESAAVILERYGAEAASILVEEANRIGGGDNITAVTIAIAAESGGESDQLDRIALLSRLGYELTRSPDLDVTLDSVFKRLLALSGGERAAIMLCEADGALMTRIAHDIWGKDDDFEPSHTVAMQALNEQRPILLINAPDDPRFGASESIVAMSLQSVLCVPMIVHDESIGVLYVDSSAGGVSFVQSDLDLLVSFASQAAAAIQNARLHDNQVRYTHEIERTRRYKDALIRSLSSALIAIDGDGLVTEWNPSASEILDVPADQAIGSELFSLIPGSVANWLRGLVSLVETGNQTVLLANEWEGELGSRDRVVLAGRVGRIRDPEEQVSGFVFVLNDRTDLVLIEEARRAERDERQRLRDLFSRYLAPSVVERLLNNPDAVELGGTRHDVAVLFADVRGFTGFSEQTSPEEVVHVLNHYLDLAVNEIFEQLGTLDKFLGDGVMALFGAPVEVADHELAAVRAAMAMAARLDELRKDTGTQVGFGIGIHAGEAIVGNIGTPQLMSYTAIGDVVNVAARLESEARSGEILISGEVYERISSYVEVEELGSIYVKGRLQPVRTYKVLQIHDAAGE
ncbi:hypothetical protein BH23CHL2_BH23CHL2_06540 [soil metagenome]